MFSLNPMDYVRKHQLKKLILQTQEKYEHTPDAAEIDARWRHPVFVADDLMRNRPRYSEWGAWRDYVQYRGRAFTDLLFNGYWCVSERRPIFLLNSRNSEIPDWSEQTSAHGVSVLGDVFLVPARLMFELDKEMRNRYDFTRTSVTVKIWCSKSVWNPLNGRQNTPLIPKRAEAWMYIANPERWEPDNGYNFKPLYIYESRNGITPKHFVYHSLRRIPSHT